MIKKTTTRKSRSQKVSVSLSEDRVCPTPESRRVRQKGTTRFSPLTIGLVIIIIVTALILGVKSLVTKHSTPSPASQTTVVQAPVPTSTPKEIQALIAKVASHLNVKQHESPTVATIQNADLLRSQNPTFYKNAQVGDKLLIWSNQAVLYSMSKDKILSVLPISLPPNVNSQTTSTTTTQTVEKATIEVRNGAGVVGLGGRTVTKLKAAGLTVLPATDAKSKTVYPSSFLIVRQGATYPNTIAKIQRVLNAPVTVLPSVEAPMKGDILLILGSTATK